MLTMRVFPLKSAEYLVGLVVFDADGLVWETTGYRLFLPMLQI
jgi:hypothetical protein